MGELDSTRSVNGVIGSTKTLASWRIVKNSMGNLATELEKACSALGLHVELGFTLSFGEGLTVHTVARMPDLGRGWPNGIQIVNSYDAYRHCKKELAEAGYGVR